MKKIILIILVSLISIGLYAQEQAGTVGTEIKVMKPISNEAPKVAEPPAAAPAPATPPAPAPVPAPTPELTPMPAPVPAPIPAQIPTPTAVAPQAPIGQNAPVDIEFLVDSSGSMQARLENSTQIEIAKQSLKNVLTSIPPTTPVALRIYAHRIPQSNKAGSCTDSELAVPFQPLNIAAISAAVDRLKPQGYTPIAYSLKQAAGDFTNKDSKHVIILLSDGEETCGGDPVLEAKNLIALGFQVVIHTIGFRVDETTRAQLQAISDATGGLYFDAADAESLKSQLDEATKKALLVDKTKEAVRGQEIQGGNGFSDAVLLTPDVEYKLSHHQRANEFDYFYVDLKAGEGLEASISTSDTGIRVTDDGRATEEGSPNAGIKILASDYKEIGKREIRGLYEKAGISAPAKTSAQKLYILVGHGYFPMHKDSPFEIKISSQSDAGSGAEAGNDIVHALPIAVGEYPGNFISGNEDKDFYQLNVKSNEAYSIIVEPTNLELRPNVTIFDRDRVKKSGKTAENKGAILRINDIRPMYDGPIYFSVEGWNQHTNTPLEYKLMITSEQIAPPPASAPAPETKEPPKVEPQTSLSPKEKSELLRRNPVKVVEKETGKTAPAKPVKPAKQSSGIVKYILMIIPVLLVLIAIFGGLVFIILKRSKPKNNG